MPLWKLIYPQWEEDQKHAAFPHENANLLIKLNNSLAYQALSVTKLSHNQVFLFIT